MSQDKLDLILTKVTRIEGALYPDADSTKPSRVTALEDRVNRLELWRSAIVGAWTMVVGALTYYKHK